MRMPLLAFLLFALAGIASSKPWWLRGTESNETDFLPPDVAFKVSALADGNQVRVRWVIADGYYLYRSRMDIKAESPDLTLLPVLLPQGKIKVDPYFGSQQIYEQQVEAVAGYTRSDFGAHPLAIRVTYQGCAEAGLCYPPIVKVLAPTDAKLLGPGDAVSVPAAAAGPAAATPHPWEGVAILGGGLAFLLAGLMLRKGRKLDLPAA